MYSYRRASTNTETAPSFVVSQWLAAVQAWASAWTREPRCEFGGEAAEPQLLACARQDHDCSHGALGANGVVWRASTAIAAWLTWPPTRCGRRHAAPPATTRAPNTAPRGAAGSGHDRTSHTARPLWTGGAIPAAETVQDAPTQDRLSAALLEAANSGANPLKTATGAVSHLNTEQE